MALKKSKNELYDDIYWGAKAEFTQQIEYLFRSRGIDPGSHLREVLECISEATAISIRSSVQELVSNIYTNEEFENDLGLSD